MKTHAYPNFPKKTLGLIAGFLQFFSFISAQIQEQSSQFLLGEKVYEMYLTPIDSQWMKIEIRKDENCNDTFRLAAANLAVYRNLFRKTLTSKPCFENSGLSDADVEEKMVQEFFNLYLKAVKAASGYKDPVAGSVFLKNLVPTINKKRRGVRRRRSPGGRWKCHKGRNP